MAIKTYKPTTPSRRNMSVTDYSSLSKVAPERSLLQPLNKSPAATPTAESPFVIVAAVTEKIPCDRLQAQQVRCSR